VKSIIGDPEMQLMFIICYRKELARSWSVLGSALRSRSVQEFVELGRSINRILGASLYDEWMD
jgi:hypothetical protein